MKLIKAELLSFYGSDREVAERAWCSTNKAKDRTDEDVERILKFVVHNRHTKVLELPVFSFRVDVPLFVDRQLVTHRMVTASIALSHRYTEAEPVFYVPDLEGDVLQIYTDTLDTCYDAYHATVKQLHMDGYPMQRAKEIGRNLLPGCLMTTREFTINLLSLANFIRLRTDKHAQLEMQMLAHQIYNELMGVSALSTTTRLLDSVGWDV